MFELRLRRLCALTGKINEGNEKKYKCHPDRLSEGFCGAVMTMFIVPTLPFCAILCGLTSAATKLARKACVKRFSPA